MSYLSFLSQTKYLIAFVLGGLVIASYEEVAKQFLFPAESIIPKEDHLEQKVLLTRTQYFNKGKVNPYELIFYFASFYLDP